MFVWIGGLTPFKVNCSIRIESIIEAESQVSLHKPEVNGSAITESKSFPVVSPEISNNDRKFLIVDETRPRSPGSEPKSGHANLAFEPDERRPNFEEFRARPRTRDGQNWAQDSTTVKDISSEDEDGLELQVKSIKF